MDTIERIFEEEEQRMLELEMQTIIREIERKKEERQKIIDELKLTRDEKAEIFKLKKENVERKILILKNEVEKFKEQKKRENEYFLKSLREMPEADFDEDEEYVICFEPEEREEQVNEISKLLKFSLDLYKFTKWSSERITKACTCNEDYFDTIKFKIL